MTPRVLVLNSKPVSLAMRSGYSSLIHYLPDVTVENVTRQTDGKLTQRALRYLVSRESFTKWYQLSSMKLEWRAWKRMRNGFGGILHVLWADSDLGYLDRVVDPRRQRLCCTFHGCADTLREVIRFPERLKQIDRIILMSASQREFFLANGVDPERLCVIPHGIDTTYFRPDRAADRTAADHTTEARPRFEVLTVGGYRRNFPLLKEIAERLLPYCDIVFQVVTAKKHHEIFRNVSNVQCFANLSDEALLRKYQTASCFLLTAEDATANNALLEGMACGLPIVSEDVGGVSDYVSQECAFVVKPGDGAAAARRLLELRDSAQMRLAMGEMARKRALELDWAVIGNATRRMYEDMPQ